MPHLFDRLILGSIALPNRIVMAPLTRNRSPGAVPTELVATYYRQRASAGLLISEGTAISQQGQGYVDVPGLYAPAQIEGWRRVTRAVHAVGGRIFAQLWHVGRVSNVELQPGGAAPVAPSAILAKTKTALIRGGVATFVETSMPRALAIDEIAGIVADFRRAALAAVNDAGFDGVEIHAANGYLVDQFLKTGANHRDDAYGGPIENRARFLIEVAQAVAGAVGSQRTGIRLAPVTPSNDIADADPQPLFEYALRQLAPLGLGYLHVIEGATGVARELPERPFDYEALRASYRAAGGRGAWMVNNCYDKRMAERAIATGSADLVSFGKAFIANPDLVRRLREDAPLNMPDRGTFYGGSAKGYTDYPTLDETAATAG
jgi:N-ethylmaleimide reductase